MNQFPDAFEFNEEFLICLADALYNCRFGTFLENNEKDRKACQNLTVSLWSWTFLPENRVTFINPLFSNKYGVIWPACGAKSIRLWENYWLRWDPDYMPKFSSPLVRNAIHNAKNENK